MKQFTFSFILFMITSICFGQDKKHEKQLDSIFSVMYEQNQFNGVVLIADKGKVILKKGYGYSNEETRKPNDEKTVFELGSCSKQFTATAIVLLKRQGKLDYNDKISKYLPELSFWDNVTIYDLLRHTSGLPEYLTNMSEEWDKTKIATNEDLIKFYANRKDTLAFKPKSKYRYNNTNYALLASIVERASGKKYADFLSEFIFKPLKMNNTFVYNRRENPKKISNYATGYVWAKNSFEKVTSENPKYDDTSVYYLDGIVGAAKVNSNVEDLYKWVTALKSNTFLTQKEFDDMTEITKTSTGKNISYGFGFDVSKGENKFSFGHTGSWDGYISFIYQNMIKDRTIIIQENFTLGAYPFDNIVQVLEDKPLTVVYQQKKMIPEAEMMQYEGIYTDEKNGDEHIISYKQGHLFYNTNRVKWDMRFFPISSAEFLGVRQGGRNGVLKFTKLENGTMRLEMLEYGKAIGNGIRKI